MLVNHGQSCLYMLRGNGGGQAGVHASARELADELNSGSFHPVTIRRRLPQHDSASNMLMCEVQIAEVLNFFGAARSTSSTWIRPGHALSFVHTCSDGMMLNRGLQFAEQSMSAYGFAEGPIDAQRARELLAMSDDDRRGVMRTHPFAADAGEVMVMTAGGSVSGHLGFEGSAMGGDAASITDFIARFLPITPCFECLLEAFERDERIDFAEIICDCWCTECARLFGAGSAETCVEHTGRGPWMLRHCSRSRRKGREVHLIYSLKHFSDACAAQASFIRKTDQRLTAAAAAILTSGDRDDAAAAAVAAAPRAVADEDEGEDEGEGEGEGVVDEGEGEVVADEDEGEGEVVADEDEGEGEGAEESPDALAARTNARQKIRTAMFIASGQLVSSDMPHDAKNERNMAKNYWLRICGWLVGTRTAEALRANKFSNKDCANFSEASVQTTSLSDAGRVAKESLIIVTVAPERYRADKCNSPEMTKAPCGLDWHARTGQLVFVDKEAGTVRMLRMQHLPSENEVLARGFFAPTDIVIVRNLAYVACGPAGDSELGAGSIFVVDLQKLTNPQTKRAVPAPKKLEVAACDGPRGITIAMPFALAASPSLDEIFVTDHLRKAAIVLELPDGGGNRAVASVMAKFAVEPTGIACSPSLGGSFVFVCVCDEIFELKAPLDDDTLWTRRRVFKFDGAVLCGLAFSRHGLGCVVDKSNGKLHELTLAKDRTVTSRCIVGAVPQNSTVFRDGRASMIKLEFPTMVTFNDRVVVVSESGGSKIRVVTNAYTFAEVLVPELRDLNALYHATADSDEHVLTLADALAASVRHRDFFETQTLANNTLAGKQGDGANGNISLVVLNMHRVRVRMYIREINVLKAWGGARLDPRSIFPVPTLKQYGDQRAKTIHEQAKQYGGTLFSYCRSSAQNAQYSKDFTLRARAVFKLRKDRVDRLKSKAEVARRPQRTEDRTALLRVCEVYRGLPQLRPTDRGRNVQGANPSVFLLRKTRFSRRRL
ncbi:hypothetical protein M885DRAFT_591231 [Pelagophyceae sp. CCMP2097]|nr:hypothetical protein M885DRAFT_591231 [Pelagophyceae sp. CCMP2097]